MKLFVAVLLICMVFSLSLFQYAQAQLINPEGDLQPTETGDIWAQTLSGSHFNEFWTYHFFLDDGIKVHITFSAENFGSLKSPVTGVRASVYGFDRKKTYQLSREYDLGHLVQDRDDFKFMLHPDRNVWFKGELPYTHEVRIETSKDGVDYDIHLKLSDIVEGVKWGNGIYTIGDEPIGIFTHIPYATVSGYVSINKKKKEVLGTAYMDHTFQNETTTKLMDSGYRFISQTDAKNWDLVYFMLPKDIRQKMTVGHRISTRNGKHDVYQINSIESMTEERTFGKRLAHSMDLMMIHPEGRLEVLTLSRTVDDERFSVLSELSWVARRAARSFLGGEVLEFRGEAELAFPGNSKVSGFYNYFVVD